MSGKPVIPREQARRDIEEIVDHTVASAGTETALTLVDAFQRAYGHISKYPASGSPRYAHELDLPGLRCWPLKRYPFLIFYVEHDTHVDVWRVLHGGRDIPAWMGEPETF